MDATRFIVAGRFIDGSGADVRRNIFMAVKNGIITAIGSAADLRNDATIDDFSHCTILPALIDCSVSLLQSPSINRVQTTNDNYLDRHLSYCHSHGVLGVAVNDDANDLGLYRTKAGDKSQICIKLSSPFHSENHPDLPLTDSDFIHIRYSNNIGDNTTQYSNISQTKLQYILEHRDGKKVVVLANGQQQVAEAIKAGCDAIEQGYNMGRDNLSQMAEKNILWIPSVLRAKNALDSAGTGGNVCCRFSLRYVAPGKPDPNAETFWQKTLAGQLSQLASARDLGVKTAVGTGAGNIGILHGESMAEEMKLFIKAGYSLEETCRCASNNGAKFFDMENLGRLNIGKKATFLITRGTVKQLPRKLSYLEGIYINGLPSRTYHKNP